MRTFLRIPLPQADDVADLTMRDGAVVRLRQHGRKGGVRLVVSHGNGLASNGYAPFWMPLTERFEVIAFDVRNHGENPLHDPALHTWESFLQDFEQIFQGMQEWLGPAPTIGAFHSLSAIIALNHTLTYGPRWDALALFDPPIYPRDGHPLQRVEHAYTQQMALRASKRPQMYESPELLASQLAMRPTFRRWVPGSHLLLARSTLRQTDQGTWILCNPRDLEANIYLTNVDATIWPRMANIPVPTILIAADPRIPDATPAAAICRAIHQELGIDYAAIPNTTHFLQIEQPAACREALIGFLEDCNFQT
jgi:pimeloyl-ACP methyl ester carboxylesterase